MNILTKEIYILTSIEEGIKSGIVSSNKLLKAKFKNSTLSTNVKIKFYEYLDKNQDITLSKLSETNIIKSMNSIFSQEMTLREVEELVSFYKTDLGQKFIKNSIEKKDLTLYMKNINVINSKIISLVMNHIKL